MNIDVTNWKSFNIKELFDIHPTKAIDGVSSEDCVGSKTPLVVNQSFNNGIAGHCDILPTENGGIITFSDTWEGETFFYQPEAFIGFAHVQGMYPKKQMSGKSLLFISVMLEFEARGRYSYGRKKRRDIIQESTVKLPVDSSGNPDYQFMEDYIDSLHHKPLKTRNKKGQVLDLNILNWKGFKVGRLFTMLNGKGITLEEIADNEGVFIAVQSGEDNNGVMGKIDLNYCKEMKYTYSEKPCLTVARSGTAGYVSFQKDGCVVGDSAKILLLPDDVASTEHYLFLQTILTANRFKYTYGRKVTKDKYLNEIIVLPVKRNADKTPVIDTSHRFSDEGYIPDWKFMEDYIKALPYGDRLEG